MTEQELVKKLYTDVEWCYSVFEHLEEVLRSEENKIDKEVLVTMKFLVKQGMKVRREE